MYQLSLALDRRAARKENAIAFKLRDDKVRDAIKKILPFKPTAAQKRVLGEIASDLEKSSPMNRLLQGDVGSGKTIVALQAAVIAMANGCQAALMAPTEILAVQHYLVGAAHSRTCGIQGRDGHQRDEVERESGGAGAHQKRRSASCDRDARAD